MTVNEVIKELEEYRERGYGNNDLLAVRASEKDKVGKMEIVRYVSFHGVHNHRFLNIYLGIGRDAQ